MILEAIWKRRKATRWAVQLNIGMFQSFEQMWKKGSEKRDSI